MSKPSISILITSYNEGQRLLATVQFFHHHFPAYPLVIVDDASTDRSTEVVAQTYPQAKIVHHHRNQGKAKAIQSGLTVITTDYICLFDADLSGLIADQIRLGFELATHQKATMVVFAQQNDSLLWKILNLQVYVSGERIIQTDLLRQFFQNSQPQNYEVELALHFWLYAQQLSYLTTPLQSTNQLKLRKWDPLTALNKSAQFYAFFLLPHHFYAFCQLLQTRSKFENNKKSRYR